MGDQVVITGGAYEGRLLVSKTLVEGI